MVNKELRGILKSIGENAKGRSLTLKLNTHIFFDVLRVKKNLFNNFKEKINKDWMEFKLKNETRVIKKTYSSFFFQYLFTFFFITTQITSDSLFILKIIIAKS